MNDDGSSQVNFTNDAAEDEYPVICGSKVVFSSDRDSPGNFDIWVANLNGSGAPTNLTPNTPGSNEHEPSCGSTIYASNRIVFRSDMDGNDEIYRMKLNGTELVRLTYHPYADENPQWCGDQIIFIRDLLGKAPCGTVSPPVCPFPPSCPSNPGTDYQIHIVGKDGEGFPGPTPPLARAVTCVNNVDPGPPPACNGTVDAVLFYWPSCHSDGAGGQDIVFSAYKPGNYEGRKIYRIPLCAQACCAHQFSDLGPTLTATASSVRNDYPSWSPGGLSITFASTRESVVVGRDWDVYRMNADDGSNLIPLTMGADEVSNEDPHWAETKP